MKDGTVIKCENITEEVIQKYQQEGYRLVFRENVMERDLSAIPGMETSLPLVLRSWSDSSASDFYNVYNASFKDRPGFPGWSMKEWTAWLSSSPTFLPERTYIAEVNNVAAGFIAADSDPEFNTRGYIIQVGVIPEWRHKGIAALMICRCLEALHKDGKKAAVLHVNQNNPGAIRLFEQLGFKTVRVRGAFELSSL